MSRAAVRVAILSDTHGLLDPRVARAAEGCDVAVHAGDVGADAVLDALAAAVRLVVAVRGNNDTTSKWRGDPDRLAALPEDASVDLPGGRLVVVHGDRAGAPAARHRRLRAAHPDARAVVYGHSHRRCVDLEDLPWVLNPGAAGRARTYGGPSLLVLDAGARRWRVHERCFEPAPRRR